MTMLQCFSMSVQPETELFLSLTPEKVLAAVEAAGLRCRPVCYPLNSFENRVYEVELEDRSRVIAKFYRPGRWSREQILEEHAFLDELEREEIPVCPLHPFPDGHTLHRIDHIDYCLFERRGGRAPDEFSDELALRAGRLTARMHNVGARRDAEHRLHLDAATYVEQNLDWLQRHDALPPALRARYLAAAREIGEIASDLMRGVATHRLHGDLHHGNLLLRDQTLNVLDFDDMVIGPAVQDVWLLFPGRDRYSRQQRELFLEGYEEFRLFDRSTLKLVEPLRGLRLVHYATWLARRYHDPIFQVTWPEFGTESYWQQETRDLEELVGVIHRELAPAGSVAAEADEALTNKDYFWDWEEDA